MRRTFYAIWSACVYGRLSRLVSVGTTILVLSSACLLCVTPRPLQAADITSHLRGVLIRGLIQKGDYSKLVDFSQTAANRGQLFQVVILDSGGGDVIESIRISQFLSQNFVSTHVLPGAHCYSACFVIWMGGVTRYLPNSAALGVHKVDLKLGAASADQTSEAYVQVAQGVTAYMAALGTPRPILEKMNTTSSSSIFILTSRWLAEHQLLTEISYRSDFLKAAQTQCGDEPFTIARNDTTPLQDDQGRQWEPQVRQWIRCAEDLRASRLRLQRRLSSSAAKVVATVD